MRIMSSRPAEDHVFVKGRLELITAKEPAGMS